MIALLHIGVAAIVERDAARLRLLLGILDDARAARDGEIGNAILRASEDIARRHLRALRRRRRALRCRRRGVSRRGAGRRSGRLGGLMPYAAHPFGDRLRGRRRNDRRRRIVAPKARPGIGNGRGLLCGRFGLRLSDRLGLRLGRVNREKQSQRRTEPYPTHIVSHAVELTRSTV